LDNIISGGFTIIEWLVSFCITLLLLILIFQFSGKFYADYIKRSETNTIFAQNVVALDNISRDILQAPCQKKLWEILSEDHIVWLDENKKIKRGYLFKNQKIYFLKNKRKNLIANYVKKLRFIPSVIDDIIHSVHCIIEFGAQKKTCCLERVIYIKNRVLS